MVCLILAYKSVYIFGWIAFQDPEQRNVIDKLANFVARNGPDFENVTKHKQLDNPKFSFLFGGEFHGYYQFKLNFERELCKIINLIEIYWVWELQISI